MVKTLYEGMKVFAGSDKTSCLLEIATSEGYLITSQMEEDEIHTPIFLHGNTSSFKNIADSIADRALAKFCNEIKGERYFVILKEGYSIN
jgi:hypothetical protein